MTTDEKWMRRAITLAKRADGIASPNPMVGAVVVDKRGKLIAEGFHKGVGTLHGEQDALVKAGKKAKGATIYTNLEPCHHRDGGRIPCSKAIFESGVSKVVYGVSDPIKDHSGGAKWLRRKGLKVEGPVLEDKCLALNVGFFSWATRKRPYIIGKVASTLDGRIATSAGESKWITGEAARADGHRLRRSCDAILVGIETVLADDPKLTYRGTKKGVDPLRVIVDSTCRTPLAASVLPANSSSSARVIIASTKRASATKVAQLQSMGAEVWCLGDKDRVPLKRVLKKLGSLNILTMLVEGGGRIHRSLIDEKLMDEFVMYLSPKALAGGASWIGGPTIEALKNAKQFEIAGAPKIVGDDIRLRFKC